MYDKMTVKKCIEYNAWANLSWIRFIYSNPSHNPYLYKLINHIVKGSRAWTERIALKEWNQDLWSVEAEGDLITLEKEIKAFLESVAPQRFYERIEIVRLNGEAYNPQIIDIFQHIFYHADHHRGQLASYAAREGLNKPVTDYMTFCISNRF